MDDLEEIKKLYGEKMSHLCRELFPTILEQPGKLTELLRANFNEYKGLYNDIVQSNQQAGFKNYILSQIDIAERVLANGSVEELLDKAGYDIYECKTGNDIAQFKKYYADDEELCTFRDGENGENRLKSNFIFWAVKKDVDQIKRAKEPRREDDYGVSVISIQISKNGGHLSIKNRYNHTVNNADATFANDLDNIIPGLTDAFNRKYGMDIVVNSGNFELPNYHKAADGKFYKYNMEINNKYYCPGNIIIDNDKVKQLGKHDPSDTEDPKSIFLPDCILMDQFILSKTKPMTIKCYDSYKKDAFLDGLEDISDRKLKEEKKTDENGEKYFQLTFISADENKSDIIIKLNLNNEIIGYENKDITQIGDNFLSENKSLASLSLLSLTRVGHDFLFQNESLANLSAPNLARVGHNFLLNNKSLTDLDFPNLVQVEDNFLLKNKSIANLSASNLARVGNNFLSQNESLTDLNFPNLVWVGNNFLSQNKSLANLSVPSLERVGYNFLFFNECLTHLSVPRLARVDASFLFSNQCLTHLNVPSLKRTGIHFLMSNECLTDLSAPNLTQVGEGFLNNHADRKKFLQIIENNKVGECHEQV